MEGGLITPTALIGTGATKGVTSLISTLRWIYGSYRDNKSKTKK
jgi:hypothetical protein